MELINPALTTGHNVTLQRTDVRHLDSSGRTGPVGEAGAPTFSDALSAAMEGVNNDQIKVTDLYQQMLVNPDSVDVHDVTLAAAQAQMSLNLAKTVVERGLQAYRDIINMR